MSIVWSDYEPDVVHNIRQSSIQEVSDAVEWMADTYAESTNSHVIYPTPTELVNIDMKTQTYQYCDAVHRPQPPGKYFPKLNSYQSTPTRTESSVYSIHSHATVPSYTDDQCSHCRFPINGKPCAVPIKYYPSVLSTHSIVYKMYPGRTSGRTTFRTDVDKTLLKLRELEYRTSTLNNRQHRSIWRESISYDHWLDNRHNYESVATSTQKHHIDGLWPCPPVKMTQQQILQNTMIPDVIFIPREWYLCSDLCCSWNCALAIAKECTDFIESNTTPMLLRQMMNHLGQPDSYTIQPAPTWKQQRGVGTGGIMPNSVFREKYCKNTFVSTLKSQDVRLIMDPTTQ